MNRSSRSRGETVLIAGAAAIVLVLAFAAQMAHGSEESGTALGVTALLLLTYAAGLALGWLSWGRKGTKR